MHESTGIVLRSIQHDADMVVIGVSRECIHNTIGREWCTDWRLPIACTGRIASVAVLQHAYAI
jgi:hypothetical protein